MVREFIDGWDVMQILGEGSFADVKLLVNRESGEACAMKEIDFTRHPGASEAVTKEICVHKLLVHTNVVRCYGSRLEPEGNKQFIFLEYCAGGELFDRIEPEHGMPEHCAHNFFRQMIDGVEYLHSRGVAHRDIKPENLLLSDTDVLKISDFGMATIFRHKGQERLLERRCGSMPYIAPEVLLKPKYHAEPADLWSCGMVLLAMVTGELPWDRPTPDQPNYVAWRSNEWQTGPWKNVDSLQLSLLRRILNQSPAKRCNIAYIKNHIWYKKRFKDTDGNLLEPELLSTPVKRSTSGGGFVCHSQPAQAFHRRDSDSSNATPAKHVQSSPKGQETSEAKDRGDSGALTAKSRRNSQEMFDFGGFSQPAKLNNYFTATQQSTQTQSGESSLFQRLVKRMTRFWVVVGSLKAEAFVTAVLTKMGYKVVTNTKGLYTIETTDRRGTVLVMKCTFIQVDGKILVDFRLSRGCGMEFKRHFAKIKLNCKEIVDKAPILWPTLLPADAFPKVV